MGFDKKLKAAAPEAPWRWRQDWIEGRVEPHLGAAVAVFALMGALFVAVAAPLAFALPKELDKGNWAALLGLLFPIAGLGLLFWAGVSFVRWRRFKGTHLILDKNPGVIGGDFCARIQLPGHLRPSQGFLATLTCIERRRGSGSNNRTTEHVLWRTEQRLAGHAVSLAPGGISLPIRFTVPYESRASTVEPARTSIVWEVRMQAELHGGDLDVSFEVPVFRTPESSSEITEKLDLQNDDDERAQALLDAGRLAQDGPDTDVALIPLAEGGFRVQTPGGSSFGAALFIGAFALFWDLMVWKLWTEFDGSMALFLVPFLLGGIVLTLVFVLALLPSGDVRVYEGRIEHKTRIPIVGGRRSLSTDEVEAIAVRVYGGRAQVRYIVEAKREGRMPLRIGAGIQSKEAADRLAAAVWQVMRGGRY